MLHSCDELAKAKGIAALIGESTQFEELLVQLKNAAKIDAPLIIFGETGSGKELFARVCHYMSARADKPFVVLNCASMPDSAIENELFGNASNKTEQQGIFEIANGGSVFLDKLGEMSPNLQLKLLRLLQDGTFRRVGEDNEIKVDIRIIGSCTVDLQALVASNQFRSDLYYRLNVLQLHIPSLRERGDDILLLANSFIKDICQITKHESCSLDKKLKEELLAYSWPGNIRQLYNYLYKSIINSNVRVLTDFNISPDISTDNIAKNTQLLSLDLTGSLDEIMQRYEEQVLEELYVKYPSTRKLAKRLGVSHTAIANKLRDYQIGK